MQTYSDGLRTKTKMKSFQAWYFYCWLFFANVASLLNYTCIYQFPYIRKWCETLGSIDPWYLCYANICTTKWIFLACVFAVVYVNFHSLPIHFAMVLNTPSFNGYLHTQIVYTLTHCSSLPPTSLHTVVIYTHIAHNFLKIIWQLNLVEIFLHFQNDIFHIHSVILIASDQMLCRTETHGKTSFAETKDK